MTLSSLFVLPAILVFAIMILWSMIPFLRAVYTRSQDSRVPTSGTPTSASTPIDGNRTISVDITTLNPVDRKRVERAKQLVGKLRAEEATLTGPVYVCSFQECCGDFCECVVAPQSSSAISQAERYNKYFTAYNLKKIICIDEDGAVSVEFREKRRRYGSSLIPQKYRLYLELSDVIRELVPPQPIRFDDDWDPHPVCGDYH